MIKSTVFENLFSRVSGISLYGLSSLRFFSFILIFANHCGYFSILGSFRVIFFFILSGFVLANRSIDLSGSAFDRKRVANFILKRFFRLGSLYYLVLAFVYLTYLLIQVFHLPHTPTLPAEGWKYLLMLSNYDHSDHLYALKFLWFISCIWQLSLVLFFLLYISEGSQELLVYAGMAITVLLFLSNENGTFEFGYFDTRTYWVYFFMGFLFRNLSKISCIVFILFLSSLYLVLGLWDLAGPINLPLGYYRQLIHISVPILLLLMIIFFFQEKLKNTYFVLKVTENLGQYSYAMYVFSGFTLTFFRHSLGIYDAFTLFIFAGFITIFVGMYSSRMVESFVKRFFFTDSPIKY